MAFDGLVTYTISKELYPYIINGKIDKIFEPNPNELLLGIYNNGTKYLLDIVISSNNYRLCLTTSRKTNPTFAPNFCMVLRKHLLNTRITNIDTLSLERIVTIEFEGNSKADDSGTKKLIIELMGKHSNVILVNANNIIIDALRHFRLEDHSYRNILPNYNYTLPISNKLDIIHITNKDEFYEKTLAYVNDNFNISNSLKLSEVIPNTYTGISKSSILSIIEQLEITDTFDEQSIDKIYHYLSSMLIDSSHTILQLVSDKNYAPFLISEAKTNCLQANFFLDDYYSKKESSESFITYRNNLSKLILNYMKKLNQKLANINQKLEECKNTELYQLYGELITNNLYRIPKDHVEELSIENYYNNNQLITIPLDKSISPSMNAKNYFKKYNKLKNAKIIVEKQKRDLESEINDLENIIYDFQSATTLFDIDTVYSEFSENFLDKNANYTNKGKKVKKNRKASKKANYTITQLGEPIKYQIDGFTIIVGKNNKQNDYITKHANPKDIWFHAKDIHGSHVILKIENELPSQDTINIVASIAAFHSKARESSNVPVDYTYIKHVKKPSNSRLGIVIYTNYKTVIIKPKKPI